MTCNISVCAFYILYGVGRPPCEKLSGRLQSYWHQEKKELHIDPDRPFAECERQDIFFFKNCKVCQLHSSLVKQTAAPQKKTYFEGFLQQCVIAQCTYIVLSRTIFVVISASPSSTMTMVCLQAYFWGMHYYDKGISLYFNQ